ncbi:protein nervous wreck isoform X2 [Bemisia tabaci]|uniref:protein nervous wreck isoform X2 n=1 Tax=Bemisia tabaci TaxID=7038 RepID=UPI003B28D5FC
MSLIALKLELINILTIIGSIKSGPGDLPGLSLRKASFNSSSSIKGTSFTRTSGFNHSMSLCLGNSLVTNCLTSISDSALLKISSAFLNKKIPNIPDIKTDGSEEKWNMWNVWRTVLEENEKLSRARLAAIEVFQQQIADDACTLRRHKMQMARKCVETLSIIQKEVQASVQDVDLNKKRYFDEEHSAHDVRDKAKDIEEKLKKKKGSFFQSITSLQKNSAKVSSRRDALEEKSAGARNDYLLSLAAANAHQTRYFVVDLQNLMLTIESNVYEKVQEYLMLIGRTELLTCSAAQVSFTRIRDQAHQLSRDYNMQCVYLYYPVLKQHIQYEFEACDNDTVDRITADHSSVVSVLSKEARRWATRVHRENNNIRENTRKLQVFQALRDSGQKSDPNDPNGPDLETKIEDLKHSIRRSEVAKAKAEARLECLRNGDSNVNVEEWLADMNLEDLGRSVSSASMQNDTSANQEAGGSDSMYDSDYTDAETEHIPLHPPGKERETSEEDHERPDSGEVDGEWAMLEQERQRIEQLTAGWDDPTKVDWGDADTADVADTETYPMPQVEPGSVYKCIALYSYTAQNPDELSIIENEQLEVVGEGDGDGWLRARNYRGEEGFVPHNYLDVEWQPATGLAGPQLQTQISFSSVDYTIDEQDPDADADADAEQEPESEQSAATTVTTREAHRPANIDISGGTWCVALYDYEATCPEEISFGEGQIIKILRKIIHDNVDDGWWEGEVDGVKGLFPSLVVEECRENGEPLTPEGEDTPPGSAPPVFTPPDVPSFLLAPQTMVTQPTPIHEFPEPPGGSKEGAQGEESEGFAMELTRGQQDQYDSQFDEDYDGESGPPPSMPPPSMPPPSMPPPSMPPPSMPPPPPVQIAVVADDECDDSSKAIEEPAEVAPAEAAPKKSKTRQSTSSADSGGGLGVAQIVITAATPMMEEAGTPFPPPPPSPPAQPPPPPPPTAAATPSPTREEGDEELENAAAKEGLDEPPAEGITREPTPFPLSSSTGSEEDTGPSTAENSQAYPAPTTQAQPELKAVPTSFQSGEIPDELEPHQLAQLQDLKESNA